MRGRLAVKRRVDLVTRLTGCIYQPQKITWHVQHGGGMTLCGLYVCTAGLLGPGLGSDEEEVVLLGFALIDPVRNQVLGMQEYMVRPVNVDLNSSFLSKQALQETRLTEAAIKTSGVSLEQAISLFECLCRAADVNPSQMTFITDGQYPLRQVLHPEASKKDITLPSYYNKFCDLRKDVGRFYGAAADTEFTSIGDMLTFLEIPNSGDTSFFGREFRDMVNLIQRVIGDGYKFNVVEAISIVLEPGICSKDEEVDSNCVVRARGLPWQSSDQDIAKFFRGLNIAKGGVALCLSLVGRRNGEALVRFTCPEHREMALKRHKHHIGQRYIEVYRASGEDFVGVAGGSNNEAQAFLTRGAQVIIRMRGLPYDCTAKQIIDFFSSGEQPCSVMDGEEGVLFVKKPDGRSTGDAFVLFKEEPEAPKALLKHRELIGSRYIELFRSTTAEVQQVLNRTMESFEPPQIVTQLPLPQVPYLPQHIITSGTRKDCIRLRGLPYEAQVENILEFLGDHAKNIVFQGVHMVYNSQGQPSGEAFIQMDSEVSAFSAAHHRHHRNMSFGKKQRYIEVFQCSGEDMNLVLTGGLSTTPGQLSPVAKTLLSPGIELPPPGPPSVPPPPPPLVTAPPPSLYHTPPPQLLYYHPLLPGPEFLLEPKLYSTMVQPKMYPAAAAAAAAAAQQAAAVQPQILGLKRTWSQAFPVRALPPMPPSFQQFRPHLPPEYNPF